MDYLKQIKYNRIIRNYLKQLIVSPLYRKSGTRHSYINNKFDVIFTTDHRNLITQSNIHALCSDLGIDFSQKAYKDIISIIEQLYNVKGL